MYISTLSLHALTLHRHQYHRRRPPSSHDLAQHECHLESGQWPVQTVASIDWVGALLQYRRTLSLMIFWGAQKFER